MHLLVDLEFSIDGLPGDETAIVDLPRLAGFATGAEVPPFSLSASRRCFGGLRGG